MVGRKWNFHFLMTVSNHLNIKPLAPTLRTLSMKRIYYFVLLTTALLLSCSDDDNIQAQASDQGNESAKFNYLALGDSYTVGQSVCGSCSFPEQLKDSLNNNLSDKTRLRIVATTGWTTSDLLVATSSLDTSIDYNLVTLLIGVNNQFRGLPINIYETEFVELLERAINLVGGDPSKVIVLSIPDYRFTPFGENINNAETISEEIDAYNAIARQATRSKGAYFENITQITRQGLSDPSLIAMDGLHLSEKAYKQIVSQLYFRAQRIINAP